MLGSPPTADGPVVGPAPGTRALRIGLVSDSTGRAITARPDRRQSINRNGTGDIGALLLLGGSVSTVVGFVRRRASRRSPLGSSPMPPPPRRLGTT